MPDYRHQKLAQVLVHYSLNIQPGDRLIMHGGDAAAPALREVYRAALQAGAHVTVEVRLDGFQEIFMREANDEQLTYISELQKPELEYYNKSLGFWSDRNTRYLSGIDPKRIARRSQSRAPLNERWDHLSAEGKLDWCGTLFPTHGLAQEAGMSLEDYENFVYSAELLDHDDPVAGWRKVHDEQQHVVDYLTQHNEIRIVAPDTDITYHVGGRTWINCSGKHNFPDGEVFTGPIEDSVNGTVRFSYPAIYGGNEVEDVQLTFKNGKVVEAHAAKGLDFLNGMLDMDAGSRILGEVAFGLNYNIPKFTRHMLFDEKLGGTMHMALGAAYLETGATNKSGLHWDMLCDLHAGTVYADGKVCYEAGKFVI